MGKRKEGEKEMIVVNLFGGPGIGKSTTAAGVFSLLKLHGVNVELVTEFAKDLVWEGRQKTLKDQYYVCAKQYHRLWRLRDDVDVAITDSPVLLSLIYRTSCCPQFHETVIKTFHDTFDNLNYVLVREKPYQPKGRNETEEQAREIDSKAEQMLIDNNVKYRKLYESPSGSINEVACDILCKLKVDMVFSIKDKWDY
jgi:hypothetical protein